MSSYFYSNCSPITVGCTLYSGSNCTGPVQNGYYSAGGSDCTTYTVTGSNGVVSSVSQCSYTLTIRAKTRTNVTEPIALYYSVNYIPVADPYDVILLGNPSGSYITSTSAGNVSDTTCFVYGTISGLINGDVVYISCYNTVSEYTQQYNLDTVTCPSTNGSRCSSVAAITMGSSNETIYITISTNPTPEDPDGLIQYQC